MPFKFTSCENQCHRIRGACLGSERRSHKVTEVILFKSLKSKLITLCLGFAFTLYWFWCKPSSMEQVPPCTLSRATNPPPAQQGNVPESPTSPCTSLGEDVCPPFLSQVPKNTLGRSLKPLTLLRIPLRAAVAPQAGTAWGSLQMGMGTGWDEPHLLLLWGLPRFMGRWQWLHLRL